MAERSLLTRIRERLRYGLATQELLDRSARLGLVYCPYYLVAEQPHELPPLDRNAPAIRFARLGPGEAPLIASLQCRPRKPDTMKKLMATAACYGIFDGDDLVGYSWANLNHIKVPLTSAVLFELDARSAYLFDMYIARTHRGYRLAPYLRCCVYGELTREGRTSFYSISLANNRSARRFKESLGAVEIEKRRAVGVRGLFVRDGHVRALRPELSPAPHTIHIRGQQAKPESWFEQLPRGA